MATPQKALDEIEPAAVQVIVSDLSVLHQMGRPKTDEEVEERINQYFAFCRESSIRPGIESLCLALHISRTTLFRWAKGIECTPRRQELAETAKAYISAYIEQAMLGGKINPASGIFVMKNWMDYKDTISFENTVKDVSNDNIPISREAIAAEFGTASTSDDMEILPPSLDD